MSGETKEKRQLKAPTGRQNGPIRKGQDSAFWESLSCALSQPNSNIHESVSKAKIGNKAIYFWKLIY
jgi:hypothetical protein